MSSLRIEYSRMGLFRFLSHMDCMPVLLRLLVKSGFPLKFSEGFSPRPRVAFLPPLSAGMFATSEWLTCQLTDDFKGLIEAGQSAIVVSRSGDNITNTKESLSAKSSPSLDYEEIIKLLQPCVDAFNSSLSGRLEIRQIQPVNSSKAPVSSEEVFLLESDDSEYTDSLEEFISGFLDSGQFPYRDYIAVSSGDNPDRSGNRTGRPSRRGSSGGRQDRFSRKRERKLEKKNRETVLDLNCVIRCISRSAQGLNLRIDGQPTSNCPGFPSNGKWIRCLIHLFKESQEESQHPVRKLDIIRTKVNLMN